MRFKDRFFAIILLIMMVFNIGRYQVPILEYNLFRGYIAKNLCVKKNIKGNCCQGKCFLRKQLKLSDENTKENTTDTNNKKVQAIQINDFVASGHAALNRNEITKFLFFKSGTFILSKFASDIFIPPQALSRLLLSSKSTRRVPIISPFYNP
ncbi:MAG: hypothetical protein Q8904_00600 [Bacteroidota bacterium]|nr:hypothetical protein [Bacteroidota bacterium]